MPQDRMPAFLRKDSSANIKNAARETIIASGNIAELLRTLADQDYLNLPLKIDKESLDNLFAPENLTSVRIPTISVQDLYDREHSTSSEPKVSYPRIDDNRRIGQIPDMASVFLSLNFKYLTTEILFNQKFADNQQSKLVDASTDTSYLQDIRARYTAEPTESEITGVADTGKDVIPYNERLEISLCYILYLLDQWYRHTDSTNKSTAETVFNDTVDYIDAMISGQNSGTSIKKNISIINNFLKELKRSYGLNRDFARVAQIKLLNSIPGQKDTITGLNDWVGGSSNTNIGSASDRKDALIASGIVAGGGLVTWGTSVVVPPFTIVPGVATVAGASIVAAKNTFQSKDMEIGRNSDTDIRDTVGIASVSVAGSFGAFVPVLGPWIAGFATAVGAGWAGWNYLDRINGTSLDRVKTIGELLAWNTAQDRRVGDAVKSLESLVKKVKSSDDYLPHKKMMSAIGGGKEGAENRESIIREEIGRLQLSRTPQDLERVKIYERVIARLESADWTPNSLLEGELKRNWDYLDPNPVLDFPIALGFKPTAEVNPNSSKKATKGIFSVQQGYEDIFSLFEQSTDPDSITKIVARTIDNANSNDDVSRTLKAVSTHHTEKDKREAAKSSATSLVNNLQQASNKIGQSLTHLMAFFEFTKVNGVPHSVDDLVTLRHQKSVEVNQLTKRLEVDRQSLQQLSTQFLIEKSNFDRVLKQLKVQLTNPDDLTIILADIENHIKSLKQAIVKLISQAKVKCYDEISGLTAPEFSQLWKLSVNELTQRQSTDSYRKKVYAQIIDAKASLDKTLKPYGSQQLTLNDLQQEYQNLVPKKQKLDLLEATILSNDKRLETATQELDTLTDKKDSAGTHLDRYLAQDLGVVLSNINQQISQVSSAISHISGFTHQINTIDVTSLPNSSLQVSNQSSPNDVANILRFIQNLNNGSLNATAQTIQTELATKITELDTQLTQNIATLESTARGGINIGKLIDAVLTSDPNLKQQIALLIGLKSTSLTETERNNLRSVLNIWGPFLRTGEDRDGIRAKLEKAFKETCGISLPIHDGNTPVFLKTLYQYIENSAKLSQAEKAEVFSMIKTAEIEWTDSTKYPKEESEITKEDGDAEKSKTKQKKESRGWFEKVKFVGLTTIVGGAIGLGVNVFGKVAYRMDTGYIPPVAGMVIGATLGIKNRDQRFFGSNKK